MKETVKVLKLRSWVLAFATAVCGFAGSVLGILCWASFGIERQFYGALSILVFMLPLLLAMVEIKVQGGNGDGN